MIRFLALIAATATLCELLPAADDNDYRQLSYFDVHSDGALFGNNEIIKRTPIERSSMVRFGKRVPMDRSSMIRFNKRAPMDRSSMVRFGKRTPIERSSMVRFGKRNPSLFADTMYSASSSI
ncbi:hypothetical protein Tcan_01443 [Toxocara canis]|uniref:Uncharacterized protein n=1 Tax=Toxocara canis TaxID=6265 RepID=A0A0B2VCC8_TOXCA|nr:hypothetical protein Tcan_01443 [Toxocara canis]